MRLRLEIDQSLPLFVTWFDGQMDKLLGRMATTPSHCDVPPGELCGIEFSDQAGQSITLGLPPCSYSEYRLSQSTQISGYAPSVRAPLVVELMAFYGGVPGEPESPNKRTEPKAAVITLESIKDRAQTRMVTDYRLDEADPLLWFLRALTDEYRGARTQLKRDYWNYLVELISRASEDERAEWENRDWFMTVVSENQSGSCSLETARSETEQTTDAYLSPTTSSGHTSVPETTERYVFRRQGKVWELAFGGGETHHLRDLKGLRYMAVLLADPNRKYGVLQLVQIIEKNLPGSITSLGEDISAENLGDRGDDQEVLDDQARECYRRRLNKMVEERSLAQAKDDIETLERLDSESKWIEAALKSSTGLGGRSRTFSTDLDKARISVGKAIKRAQTKIREQDPELADYLAQHIEKGISCSYRVAPDEIIDWEV